MNTQKTKYKQTEIGMILEDFERGDDFVKAVSEFLLKEKFLFAEDLNERTMTHKLAEYLQKYFQDYNVDCEYNRMLNNEKYDTKRLNLDDYIEYAKTDDNKGTTVFPDIIIHKRGNNENNLMVIEVKKNCNNGSKDVDFKKLKAFTSQLKYEYGIYLEFDTEKVCEMNFFKEGQEIKNEI
ncbi:MAG: hypothetical protein WBK20_03490 [Spirochaetota bacterium]